MRLLTARGLAAVFHGVAFVLVAAPPAGAAEEAKAVSFSALSLETCFATAMQHNPEIRVARLGAAADQARITQAEGSFDPALFADTGWYRRENPVAGTPKGTQRDDEGYLRSGVAKRFVTGTDVEMAATLGYGDDRDPKAAFDPSFRTEASLRVSQDLLRGGGMTVNKTQIMAAQDTWQMARESVRDTLIRTLFDVEQAYWSLFFAEADLRVREEQHARAQRLVAVAEAQVRVGEAAPIEITRSRSSAASQAVAIVSARNRIDVLRHRLLRLMGVLEPATVGTKIVLVDDPPEPSAAIGLDESLEIAYQARPDCRRAEIDRTRAERIEIQARNRVLPSLSVYGGVELSGLDRSLGDSARDVREAEFDTWNVGVRLEVPIGNRTARGAYQAASIEHRRAAERRRAVIEQTTREVADALDELNTAIEQLGTTRQAKQLAAELLQAEEKSFGLGRSSSLDVLDAQQALASAEREEVRARVGYATAFSALRVVRGDFLESSGIPAELDAPVAER